MPDHRDDARLFLGQFIPLHYHYNMLLDASRMQSFRDAIDRAVRPGARVVDLGGGTGVLSWFAAAKAARVWCVELNPELVAESRKLLDLNPNGDRVEVIHADAIDFLPPEPVDVVICEMTHAAMLREKQVEVLDSFRRRYRERFGDPPPRFVPEASILGVQPVEQDYRFSGYQAPVVLFQNPDRSTPGTRELAPLQVFRRIDFSRANDPAADWCGRLELTADGTVNALRFLTRNILWLDPERHETIDWHNQALLLPLADTHAGRAGDELEIAFRHVAGSAIGSLGQTIRCQLHRR
jgi:protein arginine N-methyltransferase 1